MNCAEFQEVLPEEFEGGRTAEQESHLKSCSACSDLVADLELIAREARQLARALPSPARGFGTRSKSHCGRKGIIREPQLRSDSGAGLTAALEHGVAGARGGRVPGCVRSRDLPARTAVQASILSAGSRLLTDLQPKRR